VKRNVLIKKLEADGWYLSRHGKQHDIYRKGEKQESVPRHNEINEMLARAILGRNGLK
jgi:mRNA interferase HicA